MITNLGLSVKLDVMPERMIRPFKF